MYLIVRIAQVDLLVVCQVERPEERLHVPVHGPGDNLIEDVGILAPVGTTFCRAACIVVEAGFQRTQEASRGKHLGCLVPFGSRTSLSASRLVQELVRQEESQEVISRRTVVDYPGLHGQAMHWLKLRNITCTG